MAGVDGHGCYGRATRVIGETDFARQFATLAVLPPLLLHERLDYGTPGLHTGGVFRFAGNNWRTKTGRELTLGAPRTNDIGLYPIFFVASKVTYHACKRGKAVTSVMAVP